MPAAVPTAAPCSARAFATSSSPWQTNVPSCSRGARWTRRPRPRTRWKCRSVRVVGADRRVERAKLAPFAVEVLGCEPGSKAAAERRPVVVGDRIPGRVAVAALDHLVLAEDALEGEAEALGRLPRGGVERVALPLHAPVAELLDGVAHEQIDGLGGRRGAPKGCAEPDVAELDRAELWRYAQVRRDPECTLLARVREREIDRVRSRLRPGERLAQVIDALIRAVRKVRPDRRIAVGQMRQRIQRL